MANSSLEERVTRAAEAAPAEQSYVSAIDVLLRLGWLAPSHLHLWRQGRVEYLERMLQASLGKQSTAMSTLRTWAIRTRVDTQRDRVRGTDPRSPPAAVKRQRSAGY